MTDGGGGGASASSDTGAGGDRSGGGAPASGRLRRYRLDSGARLARADRVLIAGSPLRLFTLTAAGVAVVDRIADGSPVPVSTLTARLDDAGAIHPIVDASGCDPPSDVTAVVPARDVPPERLAQLVGALDELGLARVLVVDDGSRSPVALPAATVIRRDVPGGPAAARNAGLAAVTTPFVLFVDADVVAGPEDDQDDEHDAPTWVDVLRAHLTADDRVAIAAPRIATTPGAGSADGGQPTASVLARYERHHSPLDLGHEPARVRARTRVSYVPSAAWLARVAALRAVGGFDAAMRTGEDVDLVWRLDEAGWRVRYEPAATVTHLARRDLRSFVGQRVGYGRSAGPLARRHRGALAPVGVSAWSAASWAAAASGPLGVATGAVIGLGSALALAPKLPLHDRWREALRLAGRGHLYAGRQLAEAVRRAWWPLALVLAVCSRRARRVVVAAVIVPLATDWLRNSARHDGHDLGFVRTVALRLLDDGAYGFGVWSGALHARTVGPLVPDLTSWPRRSRYERQPSGAAGDLRSRP